MDNNNLNNNYNYNDYSYEDEMMRKKRNRKLIAPMIVAVFTIAVLAIGATYAYITVTATSSFGSPTVSGAVPSIGSVAIAAGGSLSMNLTRTQVMAPSADTAYYATSNGVPSTTASGLQNIGFAKVTGAGTFNCTYTLGITATGNLITESVGKGTGLLVLSVQYGADTKNYDFNTAFTTQSLSGTFTGLTSTNTTSAGSANAIKASLKYVNSKTVDQSGLNGDSATITLTISNFKCTATA